MREFRVFGIPKPGGSKRAFMNRKTGRAMIVDTCKDVKAWRDSVVSAYIEAYGKEQAFDGPLSVKIGFFMPRPKGHYGKRGIRLSAPEYPTVKPDIIKLTRSTEDALTGFAWRDDCLIVKEELFKLYENGSQKPGAIIQIGTL